MTSPANMDHDPCLCELAALYALDMLDSAEQHQLDSYLAECPELEVEMEELSAAAAAIPYTVELMTPSPDLKSRLFQRINDPIAMAEPAWSDGAPREAQSGLPSASPSFLSQSPLSRVRDAADAARLLMRQLVSGNMLTVRGRELRWQPYRVPGVTVAPLHVDIARREVTALLKAEPGAAYPLHRHASFEEIYMLEGDLIVGDQVYVAGDYLRSRQGSVHGVSRSVGGCMFLVHTSLEDEYFQEQVSNLST